MADYNGLNGGLVLVKLGESFDAMTTVVGQGDMNLTHGGEPIELTNKSAGLWRVNLDGSTSTKSLDADVELEANSDTTFQTLMEDAYFARAKSYVLDFTGGTGDGYFYIGLFTPVLSTESAVKGTAVGASVQFKSSGEIKRFLVVGGVVQPEVTE